MHMKSKQSYLRKMKMILSFFYKEEDVKSIIYDYEEQFEMAKKCGNMTEIQGSSLKSPWKECQKILAEEGTSSFKAFIAQKKFKILFLILLFILSSGYIVTKCERGGISFLFPALGINYHHRERINKRVLAVYTSCCCNCFVYIILWQPNAYYAR